MARLGLTLNEAKTSVGDALRERFDFLGYTFGPHCLRKDGHWYMGASPSLDPAGVRRIVCGQAPRYLPSLQVVQETHRCPPVEVHKDGGP